MALQPKTTKQTKILGYTPDAPFTAAAWGSLRPGPVETPVDTTAGDNTAKYAADREELARRGAAGAGGVVDDGNDADTLGRPSGGAKRRAAARALLG